MDKDFYRERALRVRDIARNADPFTKKRLLELADNYDLKAGGKTRASRIIDRPPTLQRQAEA
jgi:hypothetical protein